LRTREGMKVAKAKGHLRGKQPKLNHRQEAHMVALLYTGEYTTAGPGRPVRCRPLDRLPGGRARADTEGSVYERSDLGSETLTTVCRHPVGPTPTGCRRIVQLRGQPDPMEDRLSGHHRDRAAWPGRPAQSTIGCEQTAAQEFCQRDV
jgi:hypothetical protein